MLTGMEYVSCPHLAVPAAVMQHVARVESGFNPFAIGVVGGQLQRQPHSLDEALSTVRMLKSKGYNFSVGLAQVNRANLGKYGLDSYEKAFSVCPNLVAGADILAQCYASAGGDWGKAFSCYYSGNFVTGYRDGYVQKVFNSINDGSPQSIAKTVAAIPLQRIAAPSRTASVARVSVASVNSGAYRIAIRSTPLGAVTTGTISQLATTLTSVIVAPTGDSPPVELAAGAATAMAIAAPTTTALPSAPVDGNDAPVMAEVFEPVVHGPNDPAAAGPGAMMPPATAAPTAAAGSRAAHVDRADLRKGGTDAAFVF